MNDEFSYWAPLCKLVSKLHCWARITSRTRGETLVDGWGQMLLIPREGYLEAYGWPIAIKEVEWVDLATRRVRGGLAGRPLQMIEMKEEILAGLRETRLAWELREGTWTVEGVFREEPVQMVRLLNPFGPSRPMLS